MKRRTRTAYFIRSSTDPGMYLHFTGEDTRSYIYDLRPGKKGAAVWFDLETAQRFLQLCRRKDLEIESYTFNA